MASANLFQQYLQPVKSVADYSADMDRRDLLAMQLEGQQRQNAISGLDMQGKVSAMRDAQGDQQARRGVKFTTPEEYIQALRATNRPGLMAEADAREKAFLDAGKTRSDTAKSQAEVVAKALTAQGELATRVMATPTREAAAAALANMKAITQALGVPIDFRGDEAAVAALQTPEQIKQHFAGMALKASELLPKLQTVNAGNAQVQQAVNPLTGQARETGRTAILQSPDNAATVGAQIRGQNVTAETARLARQQAQSHFEAGQNAPKWDATNQVWVDPKARTVTPAVGPDGKPLPAKAGAATEDERKAAGWLAQADNAWKNMRSVAFDANGNLKPAAKPGFNDALASVPSFGATAGVANMMRSPDRQKFMQSASSLSEALLRAATGAGVNESEARQKIQELTPVIGDSEETIKQKFDAIPMYLQALQARAGRAAQAGYVPPRAPAAAGNKAPALNQDLLNAADAIIGGR